MRIRAWFGVLLLWPSLAWSLLPRVVMTSTETARTVRVEGPLAALPPLSTFDRDGDGLADVIDPEPDVAGRDAHGANAEWYNQFCSNILVAVDEPQGLDLSFKDGVQSNAYYYVEVSAERGPAPLSFVSDRHSRLGSPVVIVEAGKTNLVPLLMGVTYSITSTVPYLITMSDYVRFTTNACNSSVRELVWPLEFEFRRTGYGRFDVQVKGPRDPGGTFTWNGNGSDGGMCNCGSGGNNHSEQGVENRRRGRRRETAQDRARFSYGVRYPLLLSRKEVWAKAAEGDRMALFEKGVRLGAGFGCQKDPKAALVAMQESDQQGYAPAALVCALAAEIAPGWLTTGGQGSNVVTAASRLYSYIGTADIGGWYDIHEGRPFVAGHTSGLSDDAFVEHVRAMYRRAENLGVAVAGEELSRFENTVREQRACQERIRKEREERERRRKAHEARMQKAATMREPLVLVPETPHPIEFAGFVLGRVYPPPVSGSTVIYGDTVRNYTPGVRLEKPFLGMDNLSMTLTPTSHRLFDMSMQRTDFKDRTELMHEGRKALDELGKKWGVTLAAFRYEAPDWPYWPSRHGCWSGSLPELYAVDESQWATSKHVFAFSHTKIGDVVVKVRLSVVYGKEFTLSWRCRDEVLTAESDREFHKSFRLAHGGQDWDEWCRERALKSSAEYQLNQARSDFTNRLELAGWVFANQVSTNCCRRPFVRGDILPWDAEEYLAEKFLGCYSLVGAGVDEHNRVCCIALSTNRTKDADAALEWYRRTREYLLSNGMDEYFVEKMSTTTEIATFIRGKRNTWGGQTMCSLDWVDKSRTVHIDLDLSVGMHNGAILYLRVYRTSRGTLDDLWRKCMRRK